MNSIAVPETQGRLRRVVKFAAIGLNCMSTFYASHQGFILCRRHVTWGLREGELASIEAIGDCIGSGSENLTTVVDYA